MTRAAPATPADVARDLLVLLGRAQGWTEAQIEMVANPAACNRAIEEIVEQGLRAVVYIDPDGFLFEVFRCGREAEGSIYVSPTMREFETARTAASRWCSSGPQLNLFASCGL